MQEIAIGSKGSLKWFLTPLFKWSVGILGAVAAGIVVFEALGLSIFTTVGFPHSYCYLRDPKMVWLHVVSDFLIGAAYVAISTTLAFLVYRASRDIPFHWVFLAFGLFIVSCGFTHFMEIWVVWQPVYWLAAYVKVVTAAASLATAVALFPIVPKVFALIEKVKQGAAHKREVERLNHELQRFNHSVAHDLRAPLRTITSFAQILDEDYGKGLDPTGKDCISRIVSGARRMDILLADLLKYSSIATEKIELTRVSLDRALQVALENLQADITRREAIIRKPETLPDIYGSETLAVLIFQNLISNALKFVPEFTRPEIRIEARLMDGKVNVCVIDNGIGIPAEARERVFQMFERLDPKYPGSGMGLALVQHSVERMQGAVEIHDAHGQRGTEFCIRFQRAR